MSRRKMEKRNIRKLSKSGTNSYYVTIPIEIIRKMRWKKGQKLVVEEGNKSNTISIKDWPAQSQRRGRKK